MLTVNTVKQFKVLQHIKQHFEVGSVSIEIVNDQALKVTDNTKAHIIFAYDSYLDKVVEIDEV